jgi:hypothetical protein
MCADLATNQRIVSDLIESRLPRGTPQSPDNMNLLVVRFDFEP